MQITDAFFSSFPTSLSFYSFLHPSLESIERGGKRKRRKEGKRKRDEREKEKEMECKNERKSERMNEGMIERRIQLSSVSIISLPPSLSSFHLNLKENERERGRERERMKERERGRETFPLTSDLNFSSPLLFYYYSPFFLYIHTFFERKGEKRKEKEGRKKEETHSHFSSFLFPSSSLSSAVHSKRPVTFSFKKKFVFQFFFSQFLSLSISSLLFSSQSFLLFLSFNFFSMNE